MLTMRMKKIVSMLLCVSTISVSILGCGNDKDVSSGTESKAIQTEDETWELALITDLGTIDDKSFNQAAWLGMKKYAEENNISYRFYQPEEGTTDCYVETIDMAITDGAKLIVCPGFLFETPVFIAQEKYPDVHFILLDGEPYNEARSESKIDKNVLAILFKEEQAGFLAGYAAVKDGNKKLGFIGGMAVPAVIHYGYGYVQGADLAAKELGINVEIMYTYTGSFNAGLEVQNMAVSWYQGGTEVIFACGGALGESVVAAAENVNAKVIGVDADQSTLSDTVLTSAMKMLTNAVYDAVKDYYSNSFAGGTKKRVSVSNNGVGIAMETSRFQTFTKKDYDKIYARLVSGEIQINNKIDDSTTADIKLQSTKVTYVD